MRNCAPKPSTLPMQRFPPIVYHYEGIGMAKVLVASQRERDKGMRERTLQIASAIDRARGSFCVNVCPFLFLCVRVREALSMYMYVPLEVEPFRSRLATMWFHHSRKGRGVFNYVRRRRENDPRFGGGGCGAKPEIPAIILPACWECLSLSHPVTTASSSNLLSSQPFPNPPSKQSPLTLNHGLPPARSLLLRRH